MRALPLPLLGLTSLLSFAALSELQASAASSVAPKRRSAKQAPLKTTDDGEDPFDFDDEDDGEKQYAEMESDSGYGKNSATTHLDDSARGSVVFEICTS
jgi:hypothetical protein